MSIVPPRPDISEGVPYDPTLIYDEGTGTWIAADGSGGSRYQSQLVVVGQGDDGTGVIYFGSL